MKAKRYTKKKKRANYPSEMSFRKGLGLNPIVMQAGGSFEDFVKHVEDYNFNDFVETLPDNLKQTGPEYNLRGMWETVGSPKSFLHVKDTEYFPLQDDGLYHGFSGGNDGNWLKSKQHPSAWEEVLHGYQLNPKVYNNYNVTYNPEGHFGENQLQYVPKTKQLYQKGGRAPIYVDNPNDPSLKAYQDSLDIYTLNRNIHRIYPNLPEITRERYDELREKENNLIVWDIDRIGLEEDKKSGVRKPLSEYVYSRRNNDYENPLYKRNLQTKEQDYTNNVEDFAITLPDGTIKYPSVIYKGKPIWDDYTIKDPSTGTVRRYVTYNNKRQLVSVYNPNIKPTKTSYYGSENLVPTDSIYFSSTGLNLSRQEKEEWQNYDIQTDRINEYKKPVQPIKYKRKPTTTTTSKKEEPIISSTPSSIIIPRSNQPLQPDAAYINPIGGNQYEIWYRNNNLQPTRQILNREQFNSFQGQDSIQIPGGKKVPLIVGTELGGLNFGDKVWKENGGNLPPLPPVKPVVQFGAVPNYAASPIKQTGPRAMSYGERKDYEFKKAKREGREILDKKEEDRLKGMGLMTGLIAGPSLVAAAPAAVSSALSTLNLPAVVGNTTLPWLTANNILGAVGAAASGSQIINPQSATNTSVRTAIENPTLRNIDDAVGNVGLTALGFVGLPYKAGALSLVDDVVRGGNYVAQNSLRGLRGLKGALKSNKYVPAKPPFSGSSNTFKSADNSLPNSNEIENLNYNEIVTKANNWSREWYNHPARMKLLNYHEARYLEAASKYIEESIKAGKEVDPTVIYANNPFSAIKRRIADEKFISTLKTPNKPQKENTLGVSGYDLIEGEKDRQNLILLDNIKKYVDENYSKLSVLEKQTIIDELVEKVGVHEGNHGITDGNRFINKGFQKDMVKIFGKDVKVPQRNPKTGEFDTPEEYVQDPSEIYARITEARRWFGIKPEDIITVQQALAIRNKIARGETSINKLFGQLIQDPEKLAEIMNYLPALTIGTGIIGASQLQQNNNTYKYGGNMKYKRQMGGAINTNLNTSGLNADKVRMGNRSKVPSVFEDVMAGLYGVGEGLLDTMTFGLTDELTDLGFKGLQSAAGTTGKQAAKQKGIAGWGNLVGAAGGAAINPASMTSAFEEGLEGIGAGVKGINPDSEAAQIAGESINALGSLTGTITGNSKKGIENLTGLLGNAKLARNGGKFYFQQGGMMNNNLGLTEIKGPTHEQGGVTLPNSGNSPEVEVEGNETIYTPENYVMSDTIKATKPALKALGLPEKYAGKTYAQISKLIKTTLSGGLRPNDPLTKKVFEQKMKKLVQAHQLDKKAKEEQDIIANSELEKQMGYNLYPDANSITFPGQGPTTVVPTDNKQPLMVTGADGSQQMLTDTPIQTQAPFTEQQMKMGGKMIKRKDGSYSRRGLWDNIRANRGSGKKPTKQMLQQEAKIKAAQREFGGYIDSNDSSDYMIPQPAVLDMYDYTTEFRDGGIFIKPSKKGTFKAQASKMGMGVQQAANTILNAPEGKYSPAMRKKANFAKNFAKEYGGYMYQMGGEMMMPQQQQQMPGGGQEQLMQMVAQALSNGTPPEQIIQGLVQQGIDEQQAVQIVEMVMQQLGGQQQQMPMQQQGMPEGMPQDMSGMQAAPPNLPMVMRKGGKLYYQRSGYLPSKNRPVYEKGFSMTDLPEKLNFAINKTNTPLYSQEITTLNPGLDFNKGDFNLNFNNSSSVSQGPSVRLGVQAVNPIEYNSDPTGFTSVNNLYTNDNFNLKSSENPNSQSFKLEDYSSPMGNYLGGLGASMVGPVANMVAAAASPDATYNYAPKFQRFNYTPVALRRAAANQALATMKDSIRTGSPTQAAYLSNMASGTASLNTALGSALAETRYGIDNQNITLANQEAQNAANVAAQNNLMKDESIANRWNLGLKGAEGIGKNFQTFLKDMGARKSQDMMINNLRTKDFGALSYDLVNGKIVPRITPSGSALYDGEIEVNGQKYIKLPNGRYAEIQR